MIKMIVRIIIFIIFIILSTFRWIDQSIHAPVSTTGQVPKTPKSNAEKNRFKSSLLKHPLSSFGVRSYLVGRLLHSATTGAANSGTNLTLSWQIRRQGFALCCETLAHSPAHNRVSTCIMMSLTKLRMIWCHKRNHVLQPHGHVP